MDFSAIVPALPGLWEGMQMTLQLMALGVLGGVVLGTLLALMRLSSRPWIANLFEAFTLATLIYFTLNMSLMLLMRVIERRVAVPGLLAAGGK